MMGENLEIGAWKKCQRVCREIQRDLAIAQVKINRDMLNIIFYKHIFFIFRIKQLNDIYFNTH
jgi:hypothetical protein